MSSAPKMRIQMSWGERLFYIVNYTLLTLVGLAALYPFVNTIAMSFSSNHAIVTGQVNLWPVEFTLMPYEQIQVEGTILGTMWNSVVLTVVGTIINMTFTILCAYPFSRKYWPGKNLVVTLLVFTMFFSGGLIPNFILIRSLGLMNTYWSLWLPGLFGIGNMIILRTFFQGLPAELEESAKIDGANDLVVLGRIFLPLSKAVIATLTLFYLVDWWNSYMGPLLYISDPKKTVLMLKLKQLLDANLAALLNPAEAGYVKEQIAPESFKAATIIISTLPIVCIYPFLQKYFVKGVMVGSIKG